MEQEIDGREGDDERTENERSPPPGSRPSRTRDRSAKVIKELARNLLGEHRIDRDRRGSVKDEHKVSKKSPNHDDIVERARRRSRSRSALRERDQTQRQSSPKFDKKQVEADDSNTNNGMAERLQGNDDGETGNENGIKRKRRLRNRGNRNRKRHNPRNNRRYKPYAELTWEERKQRDDQESERAAQRRANRPTPYNTTQFLMEDHKVDTPDLSTMNPTACDPSNESVELQDNIMDDGDLINGDYLERDFSAVYEEVQSERLEGMSKEQLVSEVLELQRRVAELENEQKNRSSSAGDSDQSSCGPHKRTRLESVSSLEGEVERLRSENMRLRKASTSKIEA